MEASIEDVEETVGLISLFVRFSLAQ